MKRQIDISIIIPMYNSEKFISKTIDSILNQKKHRFSLEIIIVDDKSTDDSIKIVKDLNDPYIRLIELDKNTGTANARNEGLKVASGYWIQFVDSDDSLCVDLYHKFERTLSKDFNVYLFSFICQYKDFLLYQTILDIRDIRAFGFFGSVCNKFIKREICIEFKKEYGVEDVCFIIDMMNTKKLKIARIPEAYYTYNRSNEQSKMANFSQAEYRKMHIYAMSVLPESNDYVKMYLLEIFVSLLFDRSMPFRMSLMLSINTLMKLFSFLPRVILNQNRWSIQNRWIPVNFSSES